jgi:acyl-homoserine lactone acylase PvdQ
VAFGASDQDARGQDLLRGWDCSVTKAGALACVGAQRLWLTVNSSTKPTTNAETPAQDRRYILSRLLRLDDRSLLAGFASWQGAIEAALKQSALALVQAFGADESKWRWGDAHWMTWRHNLGRDPELEAIFNLPNTEVGVTAQPLTQAHTAAPTTACLTAGYSTSRTSVPRAS